MRSRHPAAFNRLGTSPRSVAETSGALVVNSGNNHLETQASKLRRTLCFCFFDPAHANVSMWE